MTQRICLIVVNDQPIVEIYLLPPRRFSQMPEEDQNICEESFVIANDCLILAYLMSSFTPVLYEPTPSPNIPRLGLVEPVRFIFEPWTHQELLARNFQEVTTIPNWVMQQPEPGLGKLHYPRLKVQRFQP